MDYGVFWVGQIPGRPMIISIRNNAGDPVDLTDYQYVSMRMLDTNNNMVSLGDAQTTVVDPLAGKVMFVWPTTSVFTSPGEFLFQLELGGGSVKNFTSTQSILVREFGGVVK